MFSDAVDGSKATITAVSAAASADVLAVGFASGVVHLFDRYVPVPFVPSCRLIACAMLRMMSNPIGA